MHTTFERLERQTPSSWQTMVSWCVVIGFIALVGDWQSMYHGFKQWQEERAKTFVSPVSPEGDIVKGQIDALLVEARTEAQAGTLTPFKAAQFQTQMVTLCAKLDMRWDGGTAEIYGLAKQCYADHWEIPVMATPYFRDRLTNDPGYRAFQIQEEFDAEFFMARDGAQRVAGSFNWQQLFSFFFWLLKWYYLLTIPTFLITMINLYGARKSIREELIIGYRYWLRACCFGPIGIMLNSETASRLRRYHELLAQHQKKQVEWRRLTNEEEDALWLQTLEPMLRFDQALEQIKQSEQRIRRPLLVVVLSSLMCVRWSTMTHHRVIAPHVISATADTTPPGPPKLVPDDGGGDFDFVQDGNWMVPVVETEYRHEPWCYQSVMLAAYRPRGPPVPTCQGANPDLCPFSLVLPEEIVT